ncbi:MAG: hypothetical protein ABIR81_05530 [Ginsengibacter sp.]
MTPIFIQLTSEQNVMLAVNSALILYMTSQAPTRQGATPVSAINFIGDHTIYVKENLPTILQLIKQANMPVMK